MEITLITTFDLSQDITLDAYSDTDKVGTAVVKNEELTYYNLFANKIVKYDIYNKGSSLKTPFKILLHKNSKSISNLIVKIII